MTQSRNDKAKETDKPFFLYMAHYAIHTPLNKDKRFYQKYLDKGLSPNEACYAALIEGMDKSLEAEKDRPMKEVSANR